MIDGIKIKGTIISNINISYKDIEEPNIEVLGDLSEYEVYTLQNTIYIKTIDDSINIRLNKGPVIDLISIQLPLTYNGSIDIESLDSTISIPNINDNIKRISIEGLRNVLNISNGKTIVKMEGLNSKVFSNNVSGTIDIEGLSNDITIYDSLNISISVDGLSSKIHYNNTTRKSSFSSIHYQNTLKEGRDNLNVRASGLKSTIYITK